MPPPRKNKSAAPPREIQPDASQLEVDEENRVRHAIVEAVLSHRLPPGTRLVETRLCEAFGVNRSLLRRVFVRLAGEKVIELQHNKGAIIAQPGPEEMRQVFEARQLIENGIVRSLGKKATPQALEAVRKLVAQESAAYKAGEWSKWVRLSGEYHLQVARLLGNTELEDILRSLIARTTLMIALYDSLGHNVCSFDEHNHILDALESGDNEHACKLMGDHLHGAQVKLQRDSSPPEIDLVALFSIPS
ncbi:GntR family transcriptional regulator [Polaromonas glacialis]|uniref:GntR family transcriptional regulator n=1 Tax=Polaromonas glacialis TaxID=866564 RepID=UPI00068DFC36|nr:GntR family transcriptional regulator [Polaromonas glacialis]